MSLFSSVACPNCVRMISDCARMLEIQSRNITWGTRGSDYLYQHPVIVRSQKSVYHPNVAFYIITTKSQNNQYPGTSFHQSNKFYHPSKVVHGKGCVLLSYTNRVTLGRMYYQQTSNISCSIVGNKIVDHTDAVGATLVGAAPTTSSFSIKHQASINSTKTNARRYEKHLSFGIWCDLS